MKIKSEVGISLVEVLTSCSLFAMLALSMANAVITMHLTRGRTYHNSIASQLAIEGIENFQSLDPSTINASNSASSTIARNGISFLRAVTITVNADQSRTINVSVTCPGCKLGGQAIVTNNFPQWGSV